MTKQDIENYSQQSMTAIDQIAREEGWSPQQVTAAWKYTEKFQAGISEFIADVPQDLMRCGFVIMIELLRSILHGTTQAEFEAERGELNEEDLA